MAVPYLFAVMGPTASGKSLVAETIAGRLDAVILNADAFQVYRGMDIGTAKPTQRERYRLLDLKNPDEDFGVGEYVILAANLLQELFEEKRNVVLCGGTGLYIRALLEQYKDLMPAPSDELRKEMGEMTLDKAVIKLSELALSVASKTDLKNEIRVKRALEKYWAIRPRLSSKFPHFIPRKLESFHRYIFLKKIMQRTKEMVQNGWVAEVNALISQGYGPGNPGFRALGYESIARYVQEGGDEDGLIQQIELDTVKYAKRQRTWLRAEPNLIVFGEVSEALDAVELQVSRGNL